MRYFDDDTVLQCTITLHDLGEGFDPLREFTAVFSFDDQSGTDHRLGEIDGWICWRCLDSRLFDAADALTADAHGIAHVAEQMLHGLAWDDTPIEDVVMMDRIFIEPSHRGKNLLPDMIDKLTRLFRLDVNGCIVVTEPEPQRPDGGPYPGGSIRDRAMEGIHNSLANAGFEPSAADDTIWQKLIPGRDSDNLINDFDLDSESGETHKPDEQTASETTLFLVDPTRRKRAHLSIEVEVIFEDEQKVIEAALRELETYGFETPEEEKEERDLHRQSLPISLMTLTNIWPVEGAAEAIDIDNTSMGVDWVRIDSGE